jgi:hypothetical protein
MSAWQHKEDDVVIGPMDMDDVRRFLHRMDATIQDIRVELGLNTRDLLLIASRNKVMEQHFASLAGEVAGLGNALGVSFDMLQDHEARIRALERKTP